MDIPFNFKSLLIFIVLTMLYPDVRANISMNKGLADTVKYQRQDERKDKGKERSDNKEKPEKKQAPDKQDIISVPKARKQSRPRVISKPNIKAKPVKVIRPKIKRP